MKTLLYYDNADPNKNLYSINIGWRQKKNDRIKNGMEELAHVGNITILFCKGSKKYRKIITRTMNY